MARKILFVDDEVQILQSVKMLFDKSGYEASIAESGEKAMEILSKEPIDLIISDIRMPGMDGYQLLCKVKELYPKIPRVILSGYSDEKIVLKALQQNIAKIYVFKPWENEKLLKAIEQIFEIETILSDNNLLLHVNNIEGLPTIESSYQKIISLVENDAEIRDIAMEIEKDQSIASKVLHVVNSAYYGVRTGSVRHAVAYLGLLNIRSLLLSTSILDAFECGGIPRRNIEVHWRHAFITNKLLNYIYEKQLRKKLMEASQAAGLLHNAGIIFFMNCYKGKYVKAAMRAKQEGINILDMEKKEFGNTHQETGGYLMQWWELPYPIIETALFHHKPMDERIINKQLVQAVHLADKYASDFIGDKYTYDFDEGIFESLGFEKEKFEEGLKSFNID